MRETNYGKTASGVPITEELIEHLALRLRPATTLMRF